MSENKVLEILKAALLLEKRGKAFYSKVAEMQPAGAIKDFFNLMAAEEEEHINVLSVQFNSLKENNKIDIKQLNKKNNSAVDKVLTQSLKKEIKSAEFEAAAISAAISMEEKAIELYSNRAKEATDKNEIEMYEWLAKWEQGHFEMLMAIDKELTEKIWFDNHFWPF